MWLISLSYFLVFLGRTATLDWAQLYLIQDLGHSQYLGLSVVTAYSNKQNRVHYRQDAAKRQTASIKFTRRPKISLRQFIWNFAQPRGKWVRLVMQNFTPICARDGNAAPKWQNFSLFGKESPRMGEPFDGFFQFLGALMRPSSLRVSNLTWFI